MSKTIFCVRSSKSRVFCVLGIQRSPCSPCSVVPNSASPEALSRKTYVAIARTSCRRQDTHVGRIRTSVEYVRRRNTYVAKSRTSTKYVHRQNTYARKVRTSGKYVRHRNTYVVNLHLQCVPRTPSPKGVVGQGVVAQMTNGIKMFTNAA